jgi:hypothetical protein
MVSCDGKNEKYLAVYFNDMDNYQAWLDPQPVNVISDPNAFSGKFVSRIDSLIQYSPTLQVNNRDIGNGTPEKLLVTAWVKMENINSRPFIVVEIKDPEGVSRELINKGFSTVVKDPMRWTKLTCEIDLRESGRNNEGNYYRVYLHNEQSAFALVDDILICFQ